MESSDVIFAAFLKAVLNSSPPSGCTSDSPPTKI